MKINEEISKKDIDQGVKTYINSAEFKAKIEKIVKDRLKNDKDLEDQTVEITKNVLTQLFKTLWNRRNTWLNGLSNKNS
jgi:hypothetical protein